MNSARRPETQSAPWLSVVIPTFNGEEYLSETLESIVLQKDPDIEVVIVDDGSTDETPQIIEQFRQKLPIRFFRKDGERGWTTSTNLGLEEARGEYVTLLHQDDYWLPQRAQLIRKAITCFPDAPLLLHPVLFVDERSRVLGRWRCPFPSHQHPLQKHQVLDPLSVQNFVAIPAPVWKRSLYSEIPPLEKKLWFTADWKLWLSLAQFEGWVYLRSPLACFRIHSNAQTVQGAKTPEDYRQQYEDIHEWLRDSFGPMSQRTKRLSALSTEINVFLLSRFHGWKTPVYPLLTAALRVGPLGMFQYLSYSRIVERGWARLRLKNSDEAQGDRREASR